MRGINKSNFSRAAALVKRYDRKMIPLAFWMSLCQSLQPYFNTFMTGLMIDWLILGKNWKSIAFLVSVTVIGRAVFGWMQVLPGKVYAKKRYYMEQNYMSDKSLAYMEVPYERLESVEFTDLRQKIRFSDDSMGTFAALVDNFRTFFSQIFTVITAVVLLAAMLFAVISGGMAGLLSVFAAVAVIGILTAVLTKYVSGLQKRCGKKVSVQYEELAAGNRLAMYMAERIVFDYQMGKDLRLYGAGPVIEESDRKMTENMTRIFRKICVLMGLPNMASGVAFGLTGSIIYLIMAYWATLGYISVGNVVVYAGSAQSLISSLGAVFLSAGQFTVLLERLAPAASLLDMAKKNQREKVCEAAGSETYPSGSQAEATGASGFGEIRFCHVSFRYPGTDRDVLKDVSFLIKRGERVSIVGVNGAGKSTAIKLLCRLYRPDAGVILIDGVDIQEIPERLYRRLLAPVFQNFRLFSFALGENLSSEKAYDREKAQLALEQADFGERLKTTQKGLDTILFHDYDEEGMELSGGEMQKIALARCLYADSPILVLDEPTSALDARAEMEVYENFNRACQGRTAVFVSHRLSSCRFSDRILVFNDGKVVQNGSHEELAADRESVYGQLWNAQAQYYR